MMINPTHIYMYRLFVRKLLLLLSLSPCSNLKIILTKIIIAINQMYFKRIRTRGLMVVPIIPWIRQQTHIKVSSSNIRTVSNE